MQRIKIGEDTRIRHISISFIDLHNNLHDGEDLEAIPLCCLLPFQLVYDPNGAVASGAIEVEGIFPPLFPCGPEPVELLGIFLRQEVFPRSGAVVEIARGESDLLGAVRARVIPNVHFVIVSPSGIEQDPVHSLFRVHTNQVQIPPMEDRTQDLKDTFHGKHT